jgi:D-alanine transaminase
MIAYFNGQYVSKENIKISPDDRGFLFADGVYEVIRSYGGRLFKIDEHLSRLSRSLEELRMAPVSLAHLKTVAEQLMHRNNLENEDATLYIQITRGVAPRKHPFPDPETSPTVYVSASVLQPSPAEWETGIAVILVPDLRWQRCDIKSLGLLPNVLASQQAKEQGASEAVFVRDGVITEGSHTSFCAVFDGELVTHPANHHILDGITRSVVLDLCVTLGISVRESPILERTLKGASELMVLGTTSEVVPVVRVDDWVVGDGKPGPITSKLKQAFGDLRAA